VANSTSAETASEREAMWQRSGGYLVTQRGRHNGARVVHRFAMVIMAGAFGWLAGESAAQAQACAAPGTVTTACTTQADCAKLTVGDANGAKGTVVGIPISFEQGPNDSQSGQGFDEVAAIAFTLGVPGTGDTAPLTFDCTGGDLANDAVTPGPGLTDFAVVIENAQCTNRNRCLCPDTGAGQTRDNFVNVVVYGPRNLPEQGPVQIPVLPASGVLVTLNMRIAGDAPDSVPMHVFSAVGAPAKPQFGANLSIGDQAACDVSANGQGRSNVFIGDGTLTATGPIVTPTPGGGTCVGDCSGDGSVAINELILGVNIALGNNPLSTCPAFDANDSGMVEINELISAVNAALNGCPPAS